jgi:hypothetical protein
MNLGLIAREAYLPLIIRKGLPHFPKFLHDIGIRSRLFVIHEEFLCFLALLFAENHIASRRFLGRGRILQSQDLFKLVTTACGNRGVQDRLEPVKKCEERLYVECFISPSWPWVSVHLPPCLLSASWYLGRTWDVPAAPTCCQKVPYKL